MAQEIRVNLDSMTLGDLEKLESDSFTDMLKVFDHVVYLEGIPEEEQEEALRNMKWTAISDIADAIREAVEEATNPKEGGKN